MIQDFPEVKTIFRFEGKKEIPTTDKNAWLLPVSFFTVKISFLPWRINGSKQKILFNTIALLGFELEEN